ncbi:hypothetical protein SB6421_03812 [Klebsiella huaxiensis]|uniref:glycosyltransferase family 4 protein n=1 Tax=Klebsiella huaxiensis TaxID=2153354 RepID=UPI00116A4E36|nr:glycosyltransferase [Klebsiella huaxiensis]VUS83835.1 hypothetical protein SB6421_03812 [Klebsiella huaxiensis]
MKKMLYVTNVFEDKNDGIWSKIKYNILAYERLGFTVDIAYRKLDGEFAFKQNNLESNELSLNCRHKDLFFHALSKKITKRYDIVYIRKPIGGASVLFLSHLLKKIKKINTCQVILEIPTFPYEKEIRGAKLTISEYLLKLSRRFFLKYVDLITYMGDPVCKIWGKPVLRLSNGIDLAHVNLVRDRLKDRNEELVFIGVARLSFWHGYDRLISSIKSESNYNFKFLIVGDGEPEMSRLRKIVTDLNLNDKVIFYGAKSGDELNKIYEKADIAVDSLGRHRSGSYSNSSLKSKEYTAKGLPFIKSHQDEAFDKSYFIHDVQPNDDLIDLDCIYDWYQSLPDETPQLMRDFARQHLTWDIQCQKVLMQHQSYLLATTGVKNEII